MSQASQTFNAKESYICCCGNLAMLRTSHTDVDNSLTMQLVHALF